MYKHGLNINRWSLACWDVYLLTCTGRWPPPHHLWHSKLCCTGSEPLTIFLDSPLSSKFASLWWHKSFRMEVVKPICSIWTMKCWGVGMWLGMYRCVTMCCHCLFEVGGLHWIAGLGQASSEHFGLVMGRFLTTRAMMVQWLMCGPVESSSLFWWLDFSHLMKQIWTPSTARCDIFSTWVAFCIKNFSSSLAKYCRV